MKITQYRNKITIFLLILFIAGCVKEETNNLSSESKAWITKYKIGDNFIIKDGNGISHSFSMISSSSYFLESESSYFFIKTNIINSEYHHQDFSSNNGTEFSLSVTAGFDTFGDELYVELNGIGFAYDLKYNTLTRISSPYGYLSRSMTDDTYEDDDNIKSTIEMLDYYTVNNVKYSKVLHFVFKDYAKKTNDYSVKDIFVAQKYGLIKYILNNNLILELQ